MNNFTYSVVTPENKQGILLLGKPLQDHIDGADCQWPKLIEIKDVLFEFLRPYCETPTECDTAEYIRHDTVLDRSWKMKLTYMHVNNEKMLTVLCGMLDYSKEWPQPICHDGIIYAFESNAIMPNHCVGHFGGCAEYKPVATYTLKSEKEVIAMSKATVKPATPKTTKRAAAKPAAKPAAKKAPVKTTGKKSPAPAPKKVPASKAKPLPAKKVPVEPVAAAGKKAAVAKVAPAQKNVAATRAKVKPAAKAKPAPVGVAKTIGIDDLLTLAKSNKKTLAQNGKFTQVLQVETTRRSIRVSLVEEINLDGTPVKQLTVTNNTVLLLDAVAAKLIRTVDFGDNVTLKFSRA